MNVTAPPRPRQRRRAAPVLRLTHEQPVLGPSALLCALRSNLALERLVTIAAAPEIEVLPTTVSALEFDETGGVLLAAVSSGAGGSISLFNFESLRNGKDCPCALSLPGHSTSAVRWDPSNDQQLACTRVDSPGVYVYDIETCEDAPTFALVPQQTSIFGPPAGNMCFEFDPANPGVLAAGATDGTVRLWDVRVAKRATKTMSVAKHVLHSVLPALPLIRATTRDGIVEVDLRKSSDASLWGSASSNGVKPTRSQSLRAMCLGAHRGSQAAGALLALRRVATRPSLAAWLWSDGAFGLLDLATFKAVAAFTPPPPVEAREAPMPKHARFFGALKTDAPAPRVRRALPGCLSATARGVVAVAEAGDVYAWELGARVHTASGEHALSALALHPSSECVVLAHGQRLMTLGDACRTTRARAVAAEDF